MLLAISNISSHVSQTGMLQEFNVGKYLREHYVDKMGFLSGDYRNTEVRVMSITDI